MSNSEMSNFFTEQGRTRICVETYFLYVAGKNPRRTPLSEKMAIYGWTLSIIIGSAMVICKLKNRDYVKTVKIDSNRHIDIRSICFYMQPKRRNQSKILQLLLDKKNIFINIKCFFKQISPEEDPFHVCGNIIGWKTVQSRTR